MYTCGKKWGRVEDLMDINMVDALIRSLYRGSVERVFMDVRGLMREAIINIHTGIHPFNYRWAYVLR